MENILKEKLWNYISENNPELMFSLQEQYGVMNYLNDKISSIAQLLLRLKQEGQAAFIIEEICINELISDLLPSKYNYIKAILEEEFPEHEIKWRNDGVLLYELLNILSLCDPLLEEMDFNQENEQDRFIRYAIIGEMSTYFTAPMPIEN